MNLNIERQFAHPPATVFDYVTKNQHLIMWWGPRGTSMGEQDIDFTRLGPWFFTLIDPSGGEHVMRGEVLEIDPPNSVKFSLVTPNPDRDERIDSIVEISVASDGQGGSILTLEQSGLTDEQVAIGSTQGWQSTLDRLQDLLQQI